MSALDVTIAFFRIFDAIALLVVIGLVVATTIWRMRGDRAQLKVNSNVQEHLKSLGLRVSILRDQVEILLKQLPGGDDPRVGSKLVIDVTMVREAQQKWADLDDQWAKLRGQLETDDEAEDCPDQGHDHQSHEPGS